MSDHGFFPKVTRMGLPDYFVEHGTVNNYGKSSESTGMPLYHNSVPFHKSKSMKIIIAGAGAVGTHLCTNS